MAVESSRHGEIKINVVDTTASCASVPFKRMIRIQVAQLPKPGL